MEVPVINRIRDFEVGINSINDPSIITRALAVSRIGKLHQAYGFWKWGALIIAFLAYFTNFVSKIKSLVVRLRKIDVSVSSPTLFDDYDTDSDVSCSSSISSDDDENDEDDEEDVDSVFSRFNGYFRVKGSDYYDDNDDEIDDDEIDDDDDDDDDDDEGQYGNFSWMQNRYSRGSFGDLFSWPDLGGISSSGVVKLWDHLDFDFAGDEFDNVVASSSSPVYLAAEKKGIDGVKVKACDPRAGFKMPALLAEWKQPGKFGNKIGVDTGGVEKVYVRDDVSGGIAVGDLRKFNGVLTELTESEAEIWWDADVVISG